MVVLMEGESLFNDASSIVLFEIFLGMVKDISSSGGASESMGIMHELQVIVWEIMYLAIGKPLSPPRESLLRAACSC